MASTLCPLPTLPAAAMGQRDSQASVHLWEPLRAHFHEGGLVHTLERKVGRQEETREEGLRQEEQAENWKRTERGQRGGEVEGTREDM